MAKIALIVGNASGLMKNVDLGKRNTFSMSSVAIEGLSVAQVAKLAGTSEYIVRSSLERQGIPLIRVTAGEMVSIGKRNPVEVSKQAIEGLSVKDVAKLTDMSVPTVRSSIKDAGLNLEKGKIKELKIPKTQGVDSLPEIPEINKPLIVNSFPEDEEIFDGIDDLEDESEKPKPQTIAEAVDSLLSKGLSPLNITELKNDMDLIKTHWRETLPMFGVNSWEDFGSTSHSFVMLTEVYNARLYAGGSRLLKGLFDIVDVVEVTKLGGVVNIESILRHYIEHNVNTNQIIAGVY